MYPWYCSILTLFFLFDSITCASTNTSSSSSTEKSKILLNCGSAESVSFNGKNWTGDRGSKFMPPDYERSTTISVASSPLIHVPKIPYSTARVFQSHFSYAFPFSPGFKFIRLHFYPSSSYFNARFSVVSGQYTLLNNFSPHIMAETLQSPYFTKDFVVYLKDNILDISFIPSSSPRGAYAFVNGIEIYNFPSNFYNYASVSRKPAFEILHRVIMRTPGLLSDNKEQWQWIDDSSFIFGNSTRGSLIYAYATIKVLWGYMSEYAAPTFLYDSARTMGSDDAVNLSYNLTWRFLVETGFKYLVRLHLCEISYDVTEVNQRVFTVYINNRTVEKSLDVIALAGAPLVAIFKDYVVMVPKEETGETNQKLCLALHPNSQSKPKFQNAILNGVEIIKISDANNNLASSIQSRIEKPNNKIRLIIIIIGCIVVCSGGTLILCFILHRRRKMNSDDHPKVSAIPSTWLCYQFKLSDIKLATNNFSEALVIGEGGFGKVYRGSINGGTTQVAIKRKGPKSRQGMQEFLTEIDLLPTIHHMNLVSLLGFCQEHNELILVYEYMPCGTLRDHLYKGSNNPPLSWNQRLKICIGAARGLHYLHCGTKNSIIHRDIKSTNILLDEEWVAKVSDFGLSRLGAITASTSHVKTQVKGTFGYLDPEYYRTRTLSKKSDVYSFGVVLFEVLCARPAVLVEEEEGKVSLAGWALECSRNGTINCIIDPSLRGKIATASLIAFVEIAVKCLSVPRTQRPAMGDVVHSLELALQAQENEDWKEEVQN